MVFLCIMNGLPRFPVFVLQSSFFNHLQTLDLVPFHRSQRFSLLRVVRPENNLRNTLGVLNIVGTHSTDFEAKEDGKETSVVYCGPDKKSVAGGVVALGKFDALHVGHRALAVCASKMGPPVLLSFTDMAEVLGWEKRLPLVAPCDRKRIMSLWAKNCGGIVPQESQLEFARIRSLSPREFVEKLAKELHVKGVVAGANYRFGYKAAGDASDLAQLCREFGLEVFIVDPVMDESEKQATLPNDFTAESTREKGQVSSTRVRKALSTGDVTRVAKLLGRDHRLVFTIDGCTVETNTLCASISNALNQAPIEGVYSCKVCLMDGTALVHEECVSEGEIRICHDQMTVTLSEGSFETCWNEQRFLGVDFQKKLSGQTQV